MANQLPNIAIVGNAPKDKHALLNGILSEEELSDLCDITLYGADGQPEMEALADAVEDWHDGKVQGIVCLPFASSSNEIIGICNTEEATDVVRIYVGDGVKMASVMGDVSEQEAMKTLTKEAVTARVKQVADALKRNFFILNPRIAVVEGSGELLVVEEESTDVVAAAIAELTESKVQAFGPVSADNFFASATYHAYDALVEMYDVQCMENLKSSFGGEMLTLLGGIDIPVVLTHRCEGTLYALFMVADMVRNRKEYSIPFADPLPKLYKERKEDGEKARFAVKKKGFNPAEHRRENVNYTVAAPQKAQE